MNDFYDGVLLSIDIYVFYDNMEYLTKEKSKVWDDKYDYVEYMII